MNIEFNFESNKYISDSTHVIFSYISDIRFWLLLITINLSGNLLFMVNIDSRPILTLLFSIVVLYLIQKRIYPKPEIKFIIVFSAILLIPSLYLGSLFSWTTFIHIVIKIATGILVIAAVGKRFHAYYICIMTCISIISLVCFAFNCFGIIIPYIPIEKTDLDGGSILRVSSVIYTQLYTVSNGDFFLRNCGIFWEPGVFQGYLNLALAIMILTIQNRRWKWWLVFVLLSTTVITTFSTGGYIVLGLLWLYLCLSIKLKSGYLKFILLSIILFCLIFAFYNLSFLHDKIVSDTTRLGMNFKGLGNGLTLLFGFSYSDAAFSVSGFKTASGILNLLKYSGLVGFLCFLTKLFWVKHPSYRSVFWGFVIILILMNEPYLTCGPFWWCALFLWDYLPNVNQYKIRHGYVKANS